MNNQVKLIDADKLLKWIDAELAKQYPESVNQYVDGRETVLEILKYRIDQGTFDPDTPPVPTIKPGDKVMHVERGEGNVLWVLSEKASVQFVDVIKICNIGDLEVVE